MALTDEERTELINNYTRVLITAWSSEEYSARLSTDPHSALAEAGLVIPDDATITIVRTIPQGEHHGDIEVQVQLWEIGLATGHYEFKIPETPQIDMTELDEQELDLVAGGVDEVDVTVSCCCCPCCCCT